MLTVKKKTQKKWRKDNGGNSAVCVAQKTNVLLSTQQNGEKVQHTTEDAASKLLFVSQNTGKKEHFKLYMKICMRLQQHAGLQNAKIKIMML